MQFHIEIHDQQFYRKRKITEAHRSEMNFPRCFKMHISQLFRYGEANRLGEDYN